MVLITRPRQFFVGAGIRSGYYTTITGNGIFKDSMRNLGKIFLTGGKKIFRYLKPKAVTFLKDTVSDLKPKMQKFATDKTTEFINKMIDNPKNIKDNSTQIINEFKNKLIDEIPAIKDNVKKTFHEIVHGTGLKNKRNCATVLSRENKELLKRMLH